MFASEIYLTMAVHILLVNFGFYSDLIEGRKLNSDPDVPLQAILEEIPKFMYSDALLASETGRWPFLLFSQKGYRSCKAIFFRHDICLHQIV